MTASKRKPMAQATGNTNTPASVQHVAIEAAHLAALGDVNALAGMIEAYIAASQGLNYAAHLPCTCESPAFEILQGEVIRLENMTEILVSALAGMTSVEHKFDKRTRAEALVKWAFHIGESSEQVMSIMAAAMTISTTKPH
jgi:hypothetical protein